MSKALKINGKWPLVLPDASADEWIGNMEWHNNTWEMPRLEALHRLIKPGTVVMYIGAYKGDMPALLASWGAKLILMESTAAFWPLIKECWELNDIPQPVGFWSGLVSKRTIVSGTMPPLDQWPTRQAEYIEGAVGFTHLAESGEDIEHFPQITIDEFIRLTGIKPDIITMDVEGSELEILKGAMDTIQNVRPAWVLSVHPEFMYHNHGTYERELHDLLRNNKYKATWLDYDHEHHWLYEDAKK